MSDVRWGILTDRELNPGIPAALQKAMQAAGLKNEFEIIKATADSLRGEIEKARANGIHHFRVVGSLPEIVPTIFDNLPALMLTIKSADSILPDETGKLWPLNFLHEGLQRLVAKELGSIDLNGGAFLIGATPEMRGVVAALVRIGFRRLNLTDRDDKKGAAFIEELKKSYFNVQFQYTPRHLITQLPGVYSLVVNTIYLNDADGHLAELFYFNFLKSGATWIEAQSTSDNSALIQEVANVGADVRTGGALLSRWAEAWCEACFKVRLDLQALRRDLEKQ